MKPENLKAQLERLLLDIEFRYQGAWGAICPFSRSQISVAYGGEERTFASIDEMLDTPFIDGKPMREICAAFEIA